MIDPVAPDYTNTPVAQRRPHFDYAPADAGARPALSIVTPFYNTGDIFHETARSVMQQSMQQFEWIIVNDGSNDAQSLAMLDGYRNSDPRLRVMDHEHNRGLSAARNTGFAAAQSDLVVQLDSDDMLEPTAAEKWYWFLTAHPEYGFVKGHTVIFGARQRLHSTAFGVGAQFLTGNRVNPTAMIRRSVHQAVSGYDEEIRDGLEDWEFWLRCAHGGYWGGSVPEYLDWRRRRPDPGDRWANLRNNERSAAIHRLMRQRYARLWEKDAFPRIVPQPQPAFARVPDELPCANLLRKRKPRLLLIARCLTIGGGGKFNLDVVEQLTRRGWEITIAVTDPEENPWLANFARLTPDIFILPNVVRLVDYPRFLRYLAQSRQSDAILLTGSEIGYMLTPYLRASLPDIPLIDYCHFVNEERNSGGFPRLSLVYKDMLQATGVSSQQLKGWMVEGGGHPDRLVVQYTNIDARAWRPDADTRRLVRQDLGVESTIPVILCTGRVIPQKQPHVLARTALRLKQQGQDFVLLVAGRGQDLPWLKRFVRRYGLQRQVGLLGAVSQERVKELLAASDVFFLPSHNEGVSLAIYEAMACGLPIVGADVGGQQELVTPECGVLLEHGSESDDIQRYTQTLADLLANPQRRQAMGAAGRERVQAGFRLDSLASGMIGMINAAQARTAVAASPDVNVGQSCAVQAVEYVRLARYVAERPMSSGGNQGGRVRRALVRAALWVEHPTPRLAPLVRAGKRIVPDVVKSAVKRRLRE